MPPGGGVGITSINRETDLTEMIDEVSKRHKAGMPALGKVSMVDLGITKSRDALQQKAKPHLYFNAQNHIDKARGLGSTVPDFNITYNPSMTSNKHSVGTVAKSAAGSSTYVDLLKKQYGQV